MIQKTPRIDQLHIFDQAKASISHELDQEMIRWDFPMMMVEFKEAISAKSIEKKVDYGSIRRFTRHTLKMRGEKFKEVVGWVKGESLIPSDGIISILTTLKQLRTVDLYPGQVVLETPIKSLEPTQPQNGMIRRVIDHTIGSLNSSVGLMEEAEVKPEHSYGSDRIQVQTILRRLCSHLGIAVSFSESGEFGSEPLTAEDMTDIGLSKTRGRKR